MLVLSRKTGESLTIGEDIRITLVRVSGNRVRLGIEAPKECRVLRSELAFAEPEMLETHPPTAMQTTRELVCNIPR